MRSSRRGTAASAPAPLSAGARHGLRAAGLTLALGVCGLAACGPGDRAGTVGAGTQPREAAAPATGARPSAGAEGLRGGGRTGLGFLGGGAGGAEGFARALIPREFEFPADYGSHPRYRTEWWYFTGNVSAAGGRHYGFELTFFRYALAPEPPESRSAWATNQIYMAHFAITDVQNGRLLASEHLSRGALGLAGAQAKPFRVWVEDWQAAGDGETFTLRATSDRARLDLRLEPKTPPIPNGEGGLDRKGPEPGNASYYYSIPKLTATGTLSAGEATESVRGTAWMDREWSTSALDAGEAGWDWFALQLDDGRELMFYRIRRKDGAASPFSGGSLIGPEGQRERLGPAAVALEPLAYWTSRASGARYPVAWRLALPERKLVLTVQPYVRDQELDLSVRYWEGAIKVNGTSDGRPVSGEGYLELTGY